MNSEIFFLLMLVSVLSYGIQLPLLAHYARKVDSITTTIYRNLSLAITMLPVVFLAPIGEIDKLPNFLPLIIGASAIGAVTFLLNLNATRYLPIGIAHSVRQGSYTLAAIVFGVVAFSEFMPPIQLIFIGLILAGVIALTLSKPNTSHLKVQSVPKGVAFAVLAGIGYATGFLIYSFIARQVSPFIVAYVWEVGIGVFALMFGLVRARFMQTKLTWLPWKDAFKITAISLTTISGTLSYGFAVNYGQYALASSLITTAGLITVIGGYFILKETLTVKQASLILVVIAAIMALRFLS